MNFDTDITRNIRIIEFLKSELLTSIASLFHNLLKGSKVNRDVLLDGDLSELSDYLKGQNR